MIHGMMCPETRASAALSLIILLAPFLDRAAPLIAGARTGFDLANESTPEISVRVYSFPRLSGWMLHGAEYEAALMLRPARIRVTWVDCTSRVRPASCMSAQLPSDLIVRFLSKALPQAGVRALGIAGSSDNDAAAFIFYDRILAQRTQTRLLPVMLGRVMAHEISHLLLPRQKHSDLGLMRGQWTADDLQMTSSACLGLTAASVQFMHKEALRRVLTERSVAAK